MAVEMANAGPVLAAGVAASWNPPPGTVDVAAADPNEKLLPLLLMAVGVGVVVGAVNGKPVLTAGVAVVEPNWNPSLGAVEAIPVEPNATPLLPLLLPVAAAEAPNVKPPAVEAGVADEVVPKEKELPSEAGVKAGAPNEFIAVGRLVFSMSEVYVPKLSNPAGGREGRQ